MSDELVKGLSLELISTRTPHDISLPQDLEQRKSTIRRMNLDLSTMSDCCQLASGELLYEINSQEYWKEWGFISFQDYCDQEVGVSNSTVSNRIRVYKTLVIDLQIPIQGLRGLQWSKALRMLPHINDRNKDEVLKLIQERSFDEICAVVESVKKESDPIPDFIMPDDPTESDSEKEEKDKPTNEKMHNMKFTLAEAGYQTLMQALDLASETSGITSPNHNLLLLAHNYIVNSIASGSEALSQMHLCIQAIQAQFGIQLEISIPDPKAFEERYGVDLEQEA